MKLERLNRERWPELQDVFRDEFGEEGLPNESAKIYALIDDEETVGFFIAEENVTHVGPLHVKDKYRGKGIGTLLAQYAFQMYKDREVYVAVLNPISEAMCERLGLTKIDGTLYVNK